ncbi:MAG TPA: class I SAM-dependent methyltransferase, partial [Candidatus Elarobacter sp.]
MPFTGERYVPEVRGQIYYEHVHRYALAFEIAGGLDVLDIASGEGYGAAYLAIAARSVVGVDVDPESVRHAAARYTAMNLSFLAGSCTRIPLASHSIDLVVSFETLEHIEEHDEFMREIARVLRPDGQLLISSPNKLVYSDDAHYHNPYHARELYFDEFRDLLQRWFARSCVYGQRIIATSAIHPLRGVARGARCISPSPHGDERIGLPALPAPAYFLALCSRSG